MIIASIHPGLATRKMRLSYSDAVLTFDVLERLKVRERDRY